MRARTIVKVLMKRRKVSYTTFGKSVGLTKGGLNTNLFNNNLTTNTFIKYLNNLGYKIVCYPSEEQENVLLPRTAIDLTLEDDYEVNCPNCGELLSDQEIIKGECSHCKHAIDENVYNQTVLEEVDFSLYKPKLGRPRTKPYEPPKERKRKYEHTSSWYAKKKRIIEDKTGFYEKKTRKKLEQDTQVVNKKKGKNNENDIWLLESFDYGSGE